MCMYNDYTTDRLTEAGLFACLLAGCGYLMLLYIYVHFLPVSFHTKDKSNCTLQTVISQFNIEFLISFSSTEIKCYFELSNFNDVDLYPDLPSLA